MSICRSCRVPLPDTAYYCLRCGARVSSPGEPGPPRFWARKGLTGPLGVTCLGILLALLVPVWVYSKLSYSPPPPRQWSRWETPTPGSSPMLALLDRMRGEVEVEYGGFMKRCSPNYNFIKTKYTKADDGYTLYAVHEFYNQYSFQVGPLAGQVQGWINENRSRLLDAGIVRIGVVSPKGAPAWLDVR